MQSISTLFFTLSLLFLFFASNTFATTLVHKSFEKCAKEASEIFEGKVVSTHSKHSKDGKTIYTYVTFAQLKRMKGKVDQARTLRFEGGCAGEDCLTVAGMPTFQAGQNVILFVKRNITESTPCPIVGWAQGRFSIEVDQATGKESIRNGFGKKVIGFDAQKGELLTESASQGEQVVPIPVAGSPDALISPIPQSQKRQSYFTPFSKDEVREIIRGVTQ